MRDINVHPWTFIHNKFYEYDGSYEELYNYAVKCGNILNALYKIGLYLLETVFMMYVCMSVIYILYMYV